MYAMYDFNNHQLPTIIGMSGYARAGKDTVAGILKKAHGYQPMSFSEPLNDALLALNPMVNLNNKAPDFMNQMSDKGWTRYRTLIETVGYEQAKEIPEVRRLLQAMGTEVGRHMFGEDVWVDAMFRQLPSGERTVLTNVRFPNERQAVLDHGGVVWRVNRPGFKPALAHHSDTALDDYDFDLVIDNDGDLASLEAKVHAALAVY